MLLLLFILPGSRTAHMRVAIFVRQPVLFGPPVGEFVAGHGRPLEEVRPPFLKFARLTIPFDKEMKSLRVFRMVRSDDCDGQTQALTVCKSGRHESAHAQ